MVAQVLFLYSSCHCFCARLLEAIVVSRLLAVDDENPPDSVATTTLALAPRRTPLAPLGLYLLGQFQAASVLVCLESS